MIENDKWRQYADEPLLLKQGYLSVEKERTIRIRIAGKRAWLTLKGYISEISRSEFEYEIPLADAEKMMETMCPFKMEKRRYPVRWAAACLKSMFSLAKTRLWSSRKSSCPPKMPILTVRTGWGAKSLQTVCLPMPI
ncbi:putative adenylate cyclase [Neisseria gonorrhoeae]|uniref:Putative adenylate cyclase n=1 Tax=Neisseria gonorrhoeae TaxID=485 RepID=A0A378VTW9_NEIGO|nr:putative adenylate cyclase [Neisseria gonorrhoeae]